MFKTMKLGNKVLSGFAVVTLIAAIMGAVGYLGLRAVVANMHEVVAVRFPSVQTLLVLKEAQYSILAGERGLINRNMMEPQVRKAQYDHIEHSWKEAAEAWKIYEPLPQTREEAALWKEFVPKWDAWKKASQQVVELSREKDSLLASGIEQNDKRVDAMDNKVFSASLASRKKFLDVEAMLEKLVKLNENLARDAGKAGERASNQAMMQLAVALVVAILLSLMIGLYLKRNLAAILKSLLDESSRLTEAAVAGKLATRGNAELVDLEFRGIVEGMNSTLDAVIGPLNVAAEYVDRISKGDIPPRIADNYNGDFNEIKNNLNGCIDAVNALVADVNKLSDAAVAGQLATRANAARHHGGFQTIVEGVNQTLDAVIGPLNVAAEYVDRISKGDIPPKITDSYSGDFNEIKNNLNQCIEAIEDQANAARSIGLGDLSVQVTVRSEKDTLSMGLVDVISVLQGLQKELQRLTEASRQGQLSERGKPEQFQGAYADVIGGVNEMLDAILLPIGEGNRILAQISNGRIDELITQSYQGDHEKMKQAVNNVALVLQDLQKELQRLTEASRQGQLSERGKPEQFQGAYADVIGGVNQMLDAILLPIAEGNRVLRQIRGGDLREKVEVECQGDHQKMKEAVNGVHGWLVDLVAYVTSIANGDLTANVAKASNNDQIHEWLVLVKNNIAALVADAGMLSRAAVEGKLSTRADASRHQGDYRKIVQGVNETLDAVIGPLNVAAEYVDRISKGDIPPKITDSYSGDFNEIKNNLNQAIEAVNALVDDARMLSQAAVEGKLATRADASKHQGDFRAIVQGVNDCLDSVIGPLNVAAKYVERISKGDIPSVISDNYNGDFNEIKVNLNVLINAMQTVTNAAAQIALGNLSVEVHERSPQDQLMQALTRMVATLRELAKTAEQIADGDLTVNVKTASENDAIGNAFATMVTNLRGIVGNVGTSSDSIASATRQIATGNADLAQRTETQASSLEEIASSMEELTSTVKQNADNSQQANQLAIDASDVAVKGGQVINRVVDTMDSISSSSKKIADIISVIDGIAFQTNILALNAAVEAARAGEQGRGFAVVAGEVRNLAQRSAAAAKEIKELIGDSVDKVGNGSKLVGEAGQTVQEIVTSIKRVTDIMGEISAASVEQSSGIEQVNIAINSLDEITQQNASVVQEASSAAAALEEQAHLLVEAVNRFKLDEQSRVTQHEIARLQRLDPLQQQSQAALRAGGSSTREIKKVAQSNGYHATKPLKGQLSAKAVGSDADWNDF